MRHHAQTIHISMYSYVGNACNKPYSFHLQYLYENIYHFTYTFSNAFRYPPLFSIFLEKTLNLKRKLFNFIKLNIFINVKMKMYKNAAPISNTKFIFNSCQCCLWAQDLFYFYILKVTFPYIV